MLKRRIIAVVTGLAILAAVAGSTTILGDSFGLSVIPQAQASNAGGGGGGCC